MVGLKSPKPRVVKKRRQIIPYIHPTFRVRFGLISVYIPEKYRYLWVYGVEIGKRLSIMPTAFFDLILGVDMSEQQNNAQHNDGLVDAWAAVLLIALSVATAVIWVSGQ